MGRESGVGLWVAFGDGQLRAVGGGRQVAAGGCRRAAAGGGRANPKNQACSNMDTTNRQEMAACIHIRIKHLHLCIYVFGMIVLLYSVIFI